MESWSGHHPVTTAALLSIFDSKDAGTIHLTTADQVLYTVCEIRCAVATRNLIDRLGRQDPAGALGRAIAAFTEIGAVRFVRDLRRASADLAAAPTAARRRQCLSILEDRLFCIEDFIDSLIAWYVWGQLRSCLGDPHSSSLGVPQTD